MNWLRDNILKIFIILGVVIVAIVVVAIVFRPKGDSLVKGSEYIDLENKLQDAAIKYVGSHKKLLPTSIDKVTKIKLNTLQSNNYIGKLVAVDDASVSCDGYVEVSLLNEETKEYSFNPFITCGKYYTTKTIGNYIIDLETKDNTFERTTDEGLYKIGNEYVFRGENINNFIEIDTHLYRIIKIDENKSLQLISSTKTSNSFVWDNRYNVEKERNDGINDFLKSRLNESLSYLYEAEDSKNEEAFFSTDEKYYIIDHDYCIGKRSLEDENIYSQAECNETASLKVGLITLAEYARASIDPNCKGAFDRSCANYNYFNALGDYNNYTHLTLTGVADNTYQIYRVRNGDITIPKASSSAQLFPVIYIDQNTIYESGSGTYDDPYTVR